MIPIAVLPGLVELRGLTLWNPMAWALASGIKPVENRPWKPWKGVTHLAVHAGAKWHEDHRRQILEARLAPTVPRKSELQAHAIIGVVRLVGYVTDAADPYFNEHPEARAWFSGPFGWLVSNARELDKPIAYRGALGLFGLPASIREQLLPLCA